MKTIIAGVLIAVSIMIAGLPNRYQIVAIPQSEWAGGAAWKVDGLTGAVSSCDRTGCKRVD